MDSSTTEIGLRSVFTCSPPELIIESDGHGLESHPGDHRVWEHELDPIKASMDPPHFSSDSI